MISVPSKKYDFLPYLKEIVGDHVFVRIHRGGVEITDYAHD